MSTKILGIYFVSKSQNGIILSFTLWWSCVKPQESNSLNKMGVALAVVYWKCYF